MIRRNIPKNYLFVFFSNVQFTSGLWMIYLAGRGFSLIELGLLESIFHISSMIFEIPSGALADLIGRKYCRLSGRLLYFISLVLMWTADTFLLQAAGFAVCAFGYNLESGAGEAFTYDTLKVLGEENRYKRIAGFVEVAFQSGMIISFAIGGLTATNLGYDWVFIFSGAAAIISFLMGLTFQEPDFRTGVIHKSQDEKQPKNLKTFGKILVDSVKLIKSRPRIMFMIIFSETVLTFTTSLFFYIQNYFKGSGRTETYIGIVYAVSAALSATSSISAEWIEKKIGQKRLFVILLAMLSLCLWGVAVSPFKAEFYIACGFIEGVTFIVVSDFLNRMIPSEIRATVLSFQSMTFSLMMVILFPIIGTLAELYSFRTAFIMMAIAASGLTSVYTIMSVLRGRRTTSEEA
ncbi:MAG: MFS transporter [Spirochaetales bacterium]|uniref:MFS transporter n=1 Tax=Candidatus Thalassospirochaeta sargassi TaxID=3119039 RepID=A0AAJ1IEI7_9SPIO|nr:MFS transporter [Spirochaetales bacterium]